MSVISKEQKEFILNKIDSVDTCAQLNEIKKEIDDFTKQLLDSLLEKLDQLSGLASLLEIPTSPDEVVDWVKSFIENFLTPALAPALNIKTEYATTLADIGEITSSFINKAQEIGSCTLEVSNGLTT